MKDLFILDDINASIHANFIFESVITPELYSFKKGMTKKTTEGKKKETLCRTARRSRYKISLAKHWTAAIRSSKPEAEIAG